MRAGLAHRGGGPRWTHAGPSWRGRGGSREDRSGGDWRQFLRLVHADSGVRGGGLVNRCDVRRPGSDYRRERDEDGSSYS
jgi:hypothetical protein